MSKLLLMVMLFLSGALWGRTVKIDTFVCNPGQVVSAELSVDDLSDVGAAVFVINYDSTIVACLGIDAGATVDAAKMTYADTGAGQLVIVAPSFTAPSGCVARVRFLARGGTAGQISDLTIASADLASKDGVTDLAVKNPVSIANGMIRIFGDDAGVRRLEASFTVWPKTTLTNLTLADGDAIQASDDGDGIVVVRSAEASGAITVKPPLYGWQSRRYVLLSCPNQGLSFSLLGVKDATIASETDGGVTTYYADVVGEGSLEIVPENGTLDAGTLAAVRSSLGKELAAYPQVKRVVVKGDMSTIPVAVDLGISPALAVSGSDATARYAEPTLRITAFDPKTGFVRIKVTPGEGNAIRSQLVTGCIHVYGTDDLSKKMRFISGIAINVSGYLREDTKGEADLIVAMGTHTFLKVKAEKQIKKEGDAE